MPARPTLEQLLASHAREGSVAWIGVRPARRAPVQEVTTARITWNGLEGDRRTRPGRRAVTLFQWEHLPVIASLCARDAVAPALLRRNVAIHGFPLAAVRGGHFRLGTAVLLGTGPCAPCSRMEEALGPGGYNAVRGHGGICATVVLPGIIRCGDALTPLSEDAVAALLARATQGDE